jgi:hypothetical protein
MVRFVFGLVVALALVCMPTEASARWRMFNRGNGGGGGSSYGGVPAGHSNATAQGVANIQAATGRMGHYGGNPGYEGCAVASTWQAAYANCCYGNSGMPTWDYGLAQGANGMWYACRRYGAPPAGRVARATPPRSPAPPAAAVAETPSPDAAAESESQ